MFTLKQAVEMGIEMGMTEFAIKHHAYEGSPIISYRLADEELPTK